MQLNKEQHKAVEHSAKRLLIIAGAGTGKTQVITKRIHYFIHSLNLSPNTILALTFTNKAAKEMQDRALQLTHLTNNTLFTTFHSFGAKFLRQYGYSLGINKYFTIYDDLDQLNILKRLYPDEQQNRLQEWRYHINKAKNYALSLGDIPQLYYNPKQFQEVFQSYQHALQTNKCVDFGDLITLPIQILEQYPLIQKNQYELWQAILVDEYQDTNNAQAKLLELLVSKDTLLTVVGDEDQSIYAFRGANSTAILTFSTQFPGTQLIKLEENYRSQQHILACANQLIAHNKNRLGKTLFTHNTHTDYVEIHQFSNSIEEASWITNYLLKNKKDKTSYAILYRTNAQSRIFEQTLTQANISYNLVGSVRFYSREEIKLSLSALILLLNEQDKIAFERLLSTPSRGIGKKTLQNIFATQQTQPNLQSLWHSALQTKLSTRAKKSIQSIFHLYEEFQLSLSNNVPLHMLLTHMLEQLGIYAYYQSKDQSEGSDRAQNLEELVSAISSFDCGRESLHNFLETTYLGASEETVNNSTPITLITVHNTKGLEYDHVFVTGMEQHLFPKIDTGSPVFEEEIEEERRLCYVAVTRAKHKLYLTYAQNRQLYGTNRYQSASQFLSELHHPKYVKTYFNLDNNSLKSKKSSFPALFNVNQWVKDEFYGIGQITKSELSRTGYLVLTIQFKEKTIKVLPMFRYLEPIVFESYE